MIRLMTWFIELQNRFNESRLSKILMIYVLNRVDDLTSWQVCILIALLLMCSTMMWRCCNVIKTSNNSREEVTFSRTQKTGSRGEIEIGLYFESIGSISFNNSSIERFVFLLIFFCSVTGTVSSSSATSNSQPREGILNRTVGEGSFETIDRWGR